MQQTGTILLYIQTSMLCVDVVVLLLQDSGLALRALSHGWKGSDRAVC